MLFRSGHKSFYVSKLGVSGALWNYTRVNQKMNEWGIGVYQHLDYWDSPSKQFHKTPYRFAQVFALGPGVYFKKKASKDFNFLWKGYITGIGLGGALSDYYWVDERDYNFGSGVSVKTSFSLSAFDESLRFNLTAGNYTLFTWSGYKSSRVLYNEKLKQLNAQGDPGSTNFTSVEAELGYWSKSYKWNICFVPEFINRYTDYKYKPSRNFSTWNISIKAGCTL